MRSLLTAHKEENKRLKQETVQLKAIIKQYRQQAQEPKLGSQERLNMSTVRSESQETIRTHKDSQKFSKKLESLVRFTPQKPKQRDQQLYEELITTLIHIFPDATVTLFFLTPVFLTESKFHVNSVQHIKRNITSLSTSETIQHVKTDGRNNMQKSIKDSIVQVELVRRVQDMSLIFDLICQIYNLKLSEHKAITSRYELHRLQLQTLQVCQVISMQRNLSALVFKSYELIPQFTQFDDIVILFKDFQKNTLFTVQPS